MKKALAVVLSAAMVLGMSAMTFAEETTGTEAPTTESAAPETTESTAPETTESTTPAEESEAPETTESAAPADESEEPGDVAGVEGDASITLKAEGNTVYVNIAPTETSWSNFKVTVTWDSSIALKSGDATTDFKMALLEGTGLQACNATIPGEFIASGTYTDDAGNGSTFSGTAYTLVFDTTEEVEVSCGSSSVTINSTSTASEEPTTSETPATVSPSATPAATTGAAKTTSTGTTTTTKSGTSTTSSSTTAAKTADAAPVAAMAVLALAAAAVVVGMKKKVTE